MQERVLEPMVIAGVRMKGRYSDCGKGFAGCPQLRAVPGRQGDAAAL